MKRGMNDVCDYAGLKGYTAYAVVEGEENFVVMSRGWTGSVSDEHILQESRMWQVALNRACN